jgi:WD40 repeat protein
VVPIYEIGRWPDGTPFYAMRMVDGGTLRAAIDGAPTLAARLALLPAVIAATDAVAFAHGKRIIHRDLTPSNVLLGAYGETVVIDWGLARDLATEAARDEADGGGDGDGDGRLTGLGSVIGTAAYMPPEQAHAISVDERADVYALGAILYHLLAGKPPYRENATDRLLAAVRTGPPPAIELRAPGAPRDLRSIVAKAMARDPADRYPTARELSDELRRFTSGRLVAAHAYTTGERLRRFVGRNRAPLLVLGAAAAVIAVGGWLSIERVLDSQAHSDRTARTLLEERGRTEVLAGHPLKAIAYLGEAYDPDRPAPAVGFLLASALRELDDLEATLDCGADVEASAVSPDGVHVAAACGDVARIWRLDDHRLVATLGPHRDGFYWLAYASDGRTVGFVGKDGVARLYDGTTGAPRLSLEHRAGTEINRIAFDPDGARVVTTGADGQAVVWDGVTGARQRAIAAGSLGFLGVYGLLAPDGTTLFTATMGGVGSGWDITTGARLGSVEHGGQIIGGDLSSDGTLAATCGDDRRVRVWDLATRTPRLTLTGHTDLIWRCRFSPDGTRLLSTSNDGTAKVWDPITGALITSVDTGDIVWWGEISPDDHLFTTATLDGAVQVWDARTGALLTSHAFAGKGAHFTRDGARLVMERGDGKLQIWRRPGGRQRDHLAPTDGALVEVSPDGARAILARAGRLELWDVAAGRPLTHAPITAPFAFAADGRRLAARTAGGVVVLDADGATVATLTIADVTSLALDGDGDRLLVGDGRTGPRVFDVATGHVIASLTGATDAILADGGQRALAWRDGEPPAVWSIDDNRPPRTLIEAGAGFAPVGFSADGRRVVLHVGDGPTRAMAIFATDDGHRVVAIPVADDASRFDPGATMVTTLGNDGMVHVVRADDGQTLAAFAGERLTSAQVDATGALVVATDRRDGAVSVLDAVDGRILAQWPLVHAPTITTEERFTLGRNAAWWTPDGSAVVTRATDATVWDASTLPPGSAARVAAARRAVPWQVVDGQLRWVKVDLAGQVTRDGVPVAGVRVTASFREMPRVSRRVSWSTTRTRPREVTAITDDEGRYLLRAVPAGDYVVSARSDALGCASAAVTRTSPELDQQLDLALRGCAAAP